MAPGAPDRVNTPRPTHDTRPRQPDAKMTNDWHGTYKTQNPLWTQKQTHTTHKSSQKTRHQKLNSYWVINSLGDKICPPAAPSTPVNEIEMKTILYGYENLEIVKTRFKDYLYIQYD